MQRGLLLLVLGCTACGAAAGEGGGDTDLPTRAAGPYGKLPPDPETPLDEPVVLSDPDGIEGYFGPAVMDHGDGRWDILFSVGEGDLSRVQRAEAVDLGQGPAAIWTVLEAEAAWEASRVAHPAVVSPGIGARWGLLYEGGAGSIGYAESDDGDSFHRVSDQPLIQPLSAGEGGRLGRPSGIWLGQELWIYYEASDPTAVFVARVLSVDPPSVERMDADPDTPDRDPVLGPNPFPEQFDSHGVGAPHLRVTFFADRPVVDLWYAGTGAAGDVSIGFAGSQDGLLFKRFDENPVLPAGGARETDPAVVSDGVGAVMFFTEITRDDVAVIAVAEH